MIAPRKLKAAYQWIDRLRNALIVLIFGFVVLSGAVDIALRYATNMGSLKWTDEILRYLNIWVVFLGAAVGVKRGAHMNVDFFLLKCFNDDTVRTIRKATLVVILLCLLALSWAGTQKVMKYWNVEIQALPISIAWFYLAIPVGCVLMAVDYLLILVYGEHPFKFQTSNGEK